MIVFELACSAEHRFEGWFGSVEDFTHQAAVGLLACPLCGTSNVRRLPSAKVRTSGAVEPNLRQSVRAAPGAPAATTEVTLASVVREILARTEDVGHRFPAEARRIHYEEVPPRPIRGVATPQEVEDLTDEGIQVVALAVRPGEDIH